MVNSKTGKASYRLETSISLTCCADPIAAVWSCSVKYNTSSAEIQTRVKIQMLLSIISSLPFQKQADNIIFLEDVS